MSRVLAIDMGNTNTKYGLFEDGELRSTWCHTTAKTSEESANILAQTDAPVAFSSVVPDSAAIIQQWCQSHNRKLLNIDSASQSVISGTGGKLGADLTAAAVAALKLYANGAGALVIGLGTASTITAVSAEGKLLGVQITLGLGPTLETISARCALLPTVSHELKEISLGLDTETCIRNGTLLAHVGLVEAWIGRARTQLGVPLVTVGTGGWVTTVAAHTKMFDHVDLQLTLKGVNLLAQAAGL